MNNMTVCCLLTVLCASFGLSISANAQTGSLTVAGLRVEYTANPLGIDITSPRLSWHGTSPARGARQTAYRIQATAGSDFAGELLWDTGKVPSEQSLFIPYEGPALSSGDRVTWRVMVWDEHAQPSGWSEGRWWEMGLLDEKDWLGHWITSPGPVDTAEQRPVAMFRKNFTLKGEIQQARLYASARGLYALELNGKPVGDQELTPGWTSYDHRIQYQTYDVTELVAAGDNAIGALLADGWFRGHLGWDGKHNLYGDQTALIAQLHIRFTDGSELVIASDDTWRVTTEGPYRMADLYDGEIYDARREIPDWSRPGFDDSDWPLAARFDGKSVALVAPEGPPVRKIETRRPVAIATAPNGEILVDMGQNLVGWVRLQITGPAGTEVVLRHAEVLDPEGNLYTENLRSADATNRYILAGNGAEIYEPRFTFQGFRYVGISGYAGELTPDDITAVVVHSAMDTTGHWHSSNDLLNQLYHNIVWGQKGNFLDVPTDCPQRDERLGWTGDAQVFVPTAAFNMDVSGFFAKWLRDLALDQKDSGSVPHVIPNILEEGSQGTAGWADAATVVPWTLYQAYGDERLLRQQYTSMKSWVDYVANNAGADLIWRPGAQFGDWLAPELKHHPQLPPYRARTETDLIGTAYFAHSADIVAQAAEVLGKKADARRYRQLFEAVRRAFQAEFVTASSRLVYDTQTAYVLALAFDLLPAKDRSRAAAHLAADVAAQGNHLTTGFLGTPDLTRVLSRYGQSATAYRLLTQTSYPSWLYPVTFGATTIWERWDAIRSDGTFQDPAMTSFNHYAYGAVGRWMVNTVAGLDAASPGYRQLLIHPIPGGKLTHAEASLQTPYGLASSSWKLSGPRFTLDVEIPANTHATVILPLAAATDVQESGSDLRGASGISRIERVGKDVKLIAGAGKYRFSYSSEPLALQAMDYRPLNKDTPMRELLQVDAILQRVREEMSEAELMDLNQGFLDAPLAQLMASERYRDIGTRIHEVIRDLDARQHKAVQGGSE